MPTLNELYNFQCKVIDEHMKKYNIPPIVKDITIIDKYYPDTDKAVEKCYREYYKPYLYIVK